MLMLALSSQCWSSASAASMAVFYILKTRFQLIYDCGNNYFHSFKWLYTPCCLILILYLSVVNSWQLSVNIGIYVNSEVTLKLQTHGALAKIDPMWNLNAVKSGSHDWAWTQHSCLRWTFGVIRPGFVEKLTVENFTKLHQTKPMPSSWSTCIQSWKTRGYFCIFKAFLVFGMTWLFIYQLGKELPQSSVRC